MFVHGTRLVPLLRPEQYVEVGQYRRELEAVMHSTWHLVGTINDIPRSGDFMTTTVCEKPVMVRNFDGDAKKSRRFAHGFLPFVGRDVRPLERQVLVGVGGSSIASQPPMIRFSRSRSRR